MYQFPIGVMLDSFRLETGEAIKKAVEVGAKGLQMYATSGEYAPRNMNSEKRKELLDMVKSSGLSFSALCGDLGQGFGNKEKNHVLIEKSKRILDLAKDLETDVVTTHIGVVPDDSSNERYKIMQEACFEMSRYADQMHAHFAIETGPEPAVRLKGFLDALHSTGVAVNYDPANLIMVTGDDPVKGVYILKDYIVHTHAKDGRQLFKKDPEIVYGVVEEKVKTDPSFVELPLGEGDVDFDSYLAALEDIGYQGFLTIEREIGDNPTEDIRHAVVFLEEKIQGRSRR
ncbi:sugar phosphate isomerase/epimerase [Blautia liquoris]|uniref:Sugar phosphate isomerase/epimerase n=1 Tax=Blautia liquoris TaxID=2779518 RepID=A0A7M2RFM4_9FIRM|nr:sugar phosphate isomerase/epimerase family protein [Blautia liquoris]QOV18774.1 sugar phosphate isomerase/epimerase [Blautia liquoris]